MKTAIKFIGSLISALSVLNKLGSLGPIVAKFHPLAAVLVPLLGAGGQIIVNIVKMVIEAISVVTAHPATLSLLAIAFGYGVLHGQETSASKPVPCVEQPAKTKVAPKTPIRRSPHK